ncbi:NAD(P)-binding protein [Dentipellis sp. KUC8613]|nr:NAD(P)-binding protein [Dentipellis sp. KUC8613]
MGNQWSVIAQMFPPAPVWSIDDIPDLSGKVMLVTGGNTGIGKETVKALLAHNAKVYMACRDEGKSNSAISALEQETGRKAIFLHLDLSDLESVRKAANEFLGLETQLHVLFNNAAVMACPMDDLSKQGYDLQFATNVMGHFFLTELLMPALRAAAASSPDKKARVITTSAAANYLYTINWDSFKDGPARRAMDINELYYQSKHANVVVAREVARRYGHEGIVSISLNPGNLRTDLQRYLSGFRKAWIDRILYPAPMGALTQLWAGTSPETADFNGKQARSVLLMLGEARKETGDPEVGKRLWDWLEEQCEPF